MRKILFTICMLSLILFTNQKAEAVNLEDGYNEFTFNFNCYNDDRGYNWGTFQITDSFTSEMNNAIRQSRLTFRIYNDFANVFFQMSTTQGESNLLLDNQSGNFLTIDPSFNYNNNVRSLLTNPNLKEKYFQFTSQRSFDSISVCLGFGEDLLEKYNNGNIKLGFKIREYFGTGVENNAVRYIPSNYDNPITINEILSKISCFDQIDGDLTDQIRIIENQFYDPAKSIDNRKVIDDHPIIFSVKDLSNNTATLTIIVKVYDVTKPEIIGPESITVNSEVFLTDQDILKKYHATDNYDTEVTHSLRIDSNEYNLDTQRKLGEQKCILSAKDSFKNTITKEIKINVIDITNPEIKGPVEIKVSMHNPMSMEEIMKNFKAEDNIDGDLTNLIQIAENNYLDNIHIPGVHSIKLVVTDRSNNQGYLEFNVRLVDQEPPQFEIKDDFILKSELDDMSIEEVIELLKKNGKLSAEGSIQILIDTYTGNENTPGKYKLVFKQNHSEYYLDLIVYEKATTPKKTDFVPLYLFGGLILLLGITIFPKKLIKRKLK